MRNYIRHFQLTFAFVLMTFFASAQCEIENENFSEWEDVSEFIFQDLGITPDTAVYNPVGWFSFLRVFSIAFSDLFGGILMGPDSTDLANSYSGIRRYVVDEANEDYAVCLTPDGFADFADLFTLFECSEQPSHISFDLKYEGERMDEIEVIYVSGENDPFTAYLELESEEDFERLGILGFSNGILQGGPDEFTRFSLEINYTEGVVNDPEIMDTAMLWIFAYGDTTGIKEGLQGKYIIDNVSLEFPTASAVTVQDNYFSVYPNPTSSIVNINMQHQEPTQYRVFNAIGQEINRGQFLGNIKLNLENFGAGIYTIQVDDGKFTKMKKVIKR